MKSYALGILAAEYILKWVPKGTHQWRKFVKPSELNRYCRLNNLEAKDLTGMVFSPTKNEFCLSKDDIDTNYFMNVMKRK
jgi:2-polyprenyl-6-hydroxyphenyl methylase/3-demethylubiquinone-9 3-methyltransferase